MDLQNRSITTRLLIVGVLGTFGIVLVFTWPFLRKLMVQPPNPNQPLLVAPERTPAEISSLYKSELTKTVDALESPNITANDAHTIIYNFFFSARVPDVARTAHLKAALEFQNTDNTKTDNQKIELWRTSIKKLQTTVTAL